MMYVEPNNRIPKGMSLREFLKKFIKENDISAESAARLFRMSRTSFEKYLQGESWQWKIAHVRALSDFLQIDVPAVVDAADLDNEKTIDTADIQVCSYILAHFDIRSMKAERIIPPRVTVENYDAVLRSFFGFNSIYEYDSVGMQLAAFSKSVRKIEEEKRQRMVELWLKVAAMAFSSIVNPYEYRPDVLKALLPRIRTYTKDTKNGYRKIILALFRIGVTVVTQPYMTSTGVFGTTMLLNGKPCIIVSDQGKKYHKLWMTLLHELYHVVNDFDMLEYSGCHTSGEGGDVFFDENAADRFAMRLLVPEQCINTLAEKIEIPYFVERAAAELDVHPAIVYGVCFEWFLKNERRDILKNHAVLMPIGDTITDICFDPIRLKSVQLAIEEIKDKLYNVI